MESCRQMNWSDVAASGFGRGDVGDLQRGDVVTR
jgi:hypothetical protein